MDLKDISDISNSFHVVPSLAVMGKTPVWVSQGKYNPMRFGDRTVSPEAVARKLSSRFDMLHYLDITGIRKGKVEWNTFQLVMDAVDEVWADVGVTFADTIIDALMSGASYGIVSTKMIQSIEEVASAYELTENIIMQIDHDKGIVARDPSMKDMRPAGLIEEMSSFGMETFILYELSEGSVIPPDDIIMECLSALPGGGRLFVGAGDMDSLERLDRVGVDGAIISSWKLMGDGVE